MNSMTNRHPHWRRCFLPALLACGLFAPAALAGYVVTVTVTGRGVDEDAALKDALRKAVEQGGLNEIASRSKVKDYALEYDVVLARSSGLVKDFKILKTSTRDGVVTVKVEAKVSKTLIDATWADVAIELKKMGLPKIVVMFKETIHDLERPEGSREILQRSSSLGTMLQRKLLKLGFKLKDAGAIEAIKGKSAEIAAAEDDTATLKALASSFGAAIYIIGESRASGPQKSSTPAGVLNMWETDVTVRAFWTETGDMIFTNATNGTRSGSRIPGPPGARKALTKAGDMLAKASVFDILEAWTRGTAGGVGDIIVEVRGLTSARQTLAIKKALLKIDGVEEVSKEGLKGTVKFTVVTARTAEELVEPLIELTFDGFEWEVEDQKMKTILCTVK